MLILEDGHIGPVTIEAANEWSAPALIDKVCALRLDFLKHLKIFDTFGRGWTRRVEEVCAKAKEMAS